MIFLVFAAIAIPVEWRPPSLAEIDFGSLQGWDILANIAGFIPMGMVLARYGLRRAVIAAALLSGASELGQTVMAHRSPSVVDLATNILGAAIGALPFVRWNIHLPDLRMDGWKGLGAAIVGVALFLGVWTSSVQAVNTRGVSSPGALEAQWNFDETSGNSAVDSSGHNLTGTFRNTPKHVSGVHAGAIQLDGKKDSVDFGRAPSLRLQGSMTLSAWVNSSSFPFDDAAILSKLKEQAGYQLDTTIDKGPRTVGFKLTNACGEMMARYGATPLVAGRWYHVAGVYDSVAQTLDVYLDGKPDNGFLSGKVTGTQRDTGATLYVGRRSNLKRFEFAGSVDDVRVYSAALTADAIAADMRGERVDVPTTIGSHTSAPACAVLSDEEDKKIPLFAAIGGVLAALVCAGFWPSMAPLLYLFASGAVGFLFARLVPAGLPAFNHWMIPLVSLAGGASVAVSVKRD